MEVIPSIYETRDIGAAPAPMGGAFDNILLRPGEVKRLILPTDPRSRTKKYFEYDVLVYHKENDTTVGKMYHGVLLANPLAGFADKAVWTLREAPKQGQVGDGAEIANGSQVTVMCISGESASAVIVGGLRNDADRDDASRGHHAVIEFNGVEFRANDDGSWTLTNKGKTAADGTADPKRDTAGAGTTVKVEANGNFEVSTAKGQFIRIDHKVGKITTSAEHLVETVADRINHGAGADESAVLGDTLQGIMEEMIDLIVKPDAYMSVVGPTLGAIHLPEWLALRAKLEKFKSHQTFVKRSAR